LGLGINVASADVVTVTLTGHVTNVTNPSSPITAGTTLTATYTYDTLASTDAQGNYEPTSPPANLSLTVGGQVIQSQSNWQFVIPTPSLGGGLTCLGFTNGASPPPPSQVAAINITLYGYTANGQGWPTSSGLPTDIPAQQIGFLGIGWGTITTQAFYGVIDTLTLVPALTISPASSSFVAQQSFDAVVLLSGQVSVTSMQASVAGTPIPLTYPGTCQLAAPNNAGRPALVCPNASAVLATLGGGAKQIDWQVVLGDGSTVQQSVVWNLVL
jgi:hypothetical protein